LRQQLTERFSSPTCDLTLIEDGTSKAVADGAVIWNCLHTVKARAARFSFGIKTRVIYDPTLPSHRGRDPFHGPEGLVWVNSIWSQLLTKGTVVRDDVIESFYRTYQFVGEAEQLLRLFQVELFSYDGIPESGAFIRNPEGGLSPGFEYACIVAADMRQLAKTLKTQRRLDSTYVGAEFEIGLTFGGTELKAFVQWEENGVKKRGPATIIPNALV